MADKRPQSMTRDELMAAPRLDPEPSRPTEGAPVFAPTPGQVSIDQYLALRQVPEHRRAARRAFVGEMRVATIDEFDRLFAGLGGPGVPEAR